MPKVNPNQEPLFDANEEPQNLPLRVREAVVKDLVTLDEVTDATREEIELKEIEQLGTSALSDEIQVTAVEDLDQQDKITDEEESRIENLVNQAGIPYRQAEIEILGKNRALKLRGETPEPEPQQKRRDAPVYSGRNPYKGRTRIGRHPKRPTPRILTAGDANSGNPDLR